MDILWSFVNISHNVSAFVCVQLFFENIDISVLKCSGVHCYFLLRNFLFILKILFGTLLITTFLSLDYFFPQVPSNFFSITAHTVQQPPIYCCWFFLCDSYYYDCILPSKGWLISPHIITRFYNLLALYCNSKVRITIIYLHTGRSSIKF